MGQSIEAVDSVRLVLLKKQARALLIQIKEHEFRTRGDCLSLARPVPDITPVKQQFNSVLDQLATLDPENTPRGRIP